MNSDFRRCLDTSSSFCLQSKGKLPGDRQDHLYSHWATHGWKKGGAGPMASVARLGKKKTASFWLTVLTNKKARGVQDVFIIATDNGTGCPPLKGFTEAIHTLFPLNLPSRYVLFI